MDSTSIKSSYESSEQSIHWEYAVSTGTRTYSRGGIILAKWRWGSKGRWAAGGNPAHRNKLEVKFTDDGQWSVESHAYKGYKWWEGKFGGRPNQLPSYWTDPAPPAPGVDFKMKALDCFLVTNVLFPGQHIFKAHSPIADSSKKKGLAVPHDIILTGISSILPKRSCFSERTGERGQLHLSNIESFSEDSPSHPYIEEKTILLHVIFELDVETCIIR